MAPRLSDFSDDGLVAAARVGDRTALDELTRRHLPMVYNLARQALHDDPAVDDVVQDIMVRALRQLHGLRAPGSFRPWLAAIAVRQIGSHLAREARRPLSASSTSSASAASSASSASAAPSTPSVEGEALLRVELAAQRRQVGHATLWMGADERAAYSLWWLENVGELNRTEVAAALGTRVSHAGVRIQRMRTQLEAARKIVAALDAVPGCPALGAAAEAWDGTPSPFWRKRLGRHVLGCPACAGASAGLLPTAQLLAGLALVPVPALVFGIARETASWLGRAAAAAVAHPVVATVTAGVLAVGVTLPTTGWTFDAPLHSSSASSASTSVLRPGRVSLESAGAAGQYVAVAGDVGVLAAPADAAARERATLLALPGLADPSCFSFRRPDGRYLRHSEFRLRLSPDEGTVLFHRDATFCARPGFLPGSVALESVNYPGYFLRHVGTQLWLDQYDGSTPFRSDASFLVRSPLG